MKKPEQVSQGFRHTEYMKMCQRKRKVRLIRGKKLTAISGKNIKVQTFVENGAQEKYKYEFNI